MPGADDFLGFKSRKKVDMTNSKKTSVVGQGKFQGSDSSRSEVIEAIKQNLLDRMWTANFESEVSASRTRICLEEYKNEYNQGLENIRLKEMEIKSIREDRQNKEHQKSVMGRNDEGVYQEAVRDLESLNKKECQKQEESSRLIYNLAKKDWKWPEITRKAETDYVKFYNDYDSAAMKYYVLMRKQTTPSSQTTAPSVDLDSGYEKDIQEYIGILDLKNLISTIGHLIESPQNQIKISIIADPDKIPEPGSFNTVDNVRQIKHHKGIRAKKIIPGSTENVNTKLDNKYQEKASHQQNSAGSQNGILAVNRKDIHGFYMDTADTLMIHTLKTIKKRTVTVTTDNGNKIEKETKNVRGIFIDDEFLPEDTSVYQSPEDADYFSRKKVKKSEGTFAVGRQMAEDIRNSLFFDHICSEMIQIYMKYHGDDLDLITEILNTNSQPSVQMNMPVLADINEDNALKVVASVLYHGYKTVEDIRNELKNDVLWKKSLFPRLVRLMLAMDDNNSKNALEKLFENAAITTNNAYKEAFANSDFVTLYALCDAAERSNKALEGLKYVWQFFQGDGPKVPDGKSGTELNGLLNWETIENLYDSGNSLWALLSGRVTKLKNLEDAIAQAEKSGASMGLIEKLQSQKESIEDEIDHGKLSEVLSIFDNVLGLAQNILSVVDMLKNQSVLSDEHSQEKDLGSHYVTWFDYVIDAGDTLLGLVNSIAGLFSDYTDIAKKEFSGLEDATDTLGMIDDTFRLIKSIYYTVQSGRKYHNISKAEYEIQTINNLNLSNSNFKQTVSNNTFIIQFLGSARRKAGKDISENFTGVITSAIDVSSNAVDPVTSVILSLCSKFIEFSSKSISNGIYRKREEKAAFVAAFGEAQAEKYMNHPDGDQILSSYTGIKSRKHLAVVTRIVAAIDTHAMLKNVNNKSVDANQWKLVKTAISAFYALNGSDDDAKARCARIPFAAILGHVGEGDDWRAKLSAALA